SAQRHMKTQAEPAALQDQTSLISTATALIGPKAWRCPMQNITNFIPSAVNALKHPERGSPTSQRPASIDRHSAEVINKVFVDLQASFPAWKQVWPDTDSLNSAKRIWTVAFIEAGISSVAQIQRGLKQCRHHGSAWPPAVGLFLKWCRAEQATPESL